VAPPVVNALLLQLTDSRTVIGMAYLAHVASLPALIPAAMLNQRLRTRRQVLAGSHVIIGLLYMLVGVVVWLLWQQPTVAIALVFVLLACTWLTLGAAIAPAFELMSLLFGRHYGKVSGWQFFTNRAIGVVGGLIATWLLASWAWPANFTLVFLLGGAIMIAGNIFILFVDEPATTPRTSIQTLRSFTRALTDQVMRHRDFMRLLVVAALTGLFQSVLNFYSVFAFDAVALPLAAAGLLAATGFIASAFGALFGGSWGDRRGHRALMRVALVTYIISLVLLLPAWQPAFFVAWLLGNAALITMMIARINLAMDLAPAGDKGTYTMVVYMVAQPVLGLSAVGAGAIIDLAGYVPFFTVTLVLALIALGFTFLFTDPRLAPDFS
jgi:MFS family permease